MLKTSPVFQLIKSMNMSEKRYFKLNSSMHVIGEKNNYAVLFDILDKSDSEDELKIKKELQKRSIKVDYFSADKNYLYQQLIKSLNEFHQEKTINLVIKGLLMSIEILFHKGLYPEVLKLINRAEKLALKCENFPLLIDVLNWKKKALGYSFGLEKASSVNQEIEKYIRTINQLKKITDLYYQSYEIQSQFEKKPSKEAREKLKKIIEQREIRDDTTMLSFNANVYRMLIHSHYYFISDEKQKELFILEGLLTELKKNEIYTSENPLDYISIFNRFLEIKKQLRHDDLYLHLKLLREFPKGISIRKEIAEERVFVLCNTHELENFLLNDDYQKTVVKIKEIEKNILKFNLSIEPYYLIHFYYFNAISLLFMGENRKAVKFIFTVLNRFELKDRPQLFRRLELLNLIAHFELGNTELLRSLSKKIISENKNDGILLDFEVKLINCMNTLSSKKRSSEMERKLYWEELRQELVSEKNKSGFGVESLLVNYLKWIDSKSKRKRVSDL